MPQCAGFVGVLLTSRTREMRRENIRKYMSRGIWSVRFWRNLR